MARTSFWGIDMSFETRLKQWDRAGRDVGVWWGFLFPAGLAVYAGSCIEREEAIFFGDSTQWITTLEGERAVALGVVWLAAALMLHFHFFWGRIRQTWLLGVIGELLSFIVFIFAIVRTCLTG
jgi:hypothetical protein